MKIFRKCKIPFSAFVDDVFEVDSTNRGWCRILQTRYTLHLQELKIECPKFRNWIYIYIYTWFLHKRTCFLWRNRLWIDLYRLSLNSCHVGDTYLLILAHRQHRLLCICIYVLTVQFIRSHWRLTRTSLAAGNFGTH